MRPSSLGLLTDARSYLVGFREPRDPKGKGKSVADLPAQWKAAVTSLGRACSVPVAAMLLPVDHPHIMRVRRELAQKGLSTGAGGKDAVDWGRCADRHVRARHEERLGTLRPYTDWEEGGGGPPMFDGAWPDFAAHGQGMTERVYDLLDVNTLRLAKLGVDVRYKTVIWNLSRA